jgi:hypothetical protein
MTAIRAGVCVMLALAGCLPAWAAWQRSDDDLADTAAYSSEIDSGRFIAVGLRRPDLPAKLYVRMGLNWRVCDDSTLEGGIRSLVRIRTAGAATPFAEMFGDEGRAVGSEADAPLPYSISFSPYRDFCAARALGRVRGALKDPLSGVQIVGWLLDPGEQAGEDVSDYALRAFRLWLARKYGPAGPEGEGSGAMTGEAEARLLAANPVALSEAWDAKLSSFEDVQIPRSSANIAALLDWQAFRTEAATAFLKAQVAAITSADPLRRPVVIEAPGAPPSLLAASQYKAASATVGGGPDSVALQASYLRHCAPEKSLWLTLDGAGRPGGALDKMAWRAIGAGARAIMLTDDTSRGTAAGELRAAQFAHCLHRIEPYLLDAVPYDEVAPPNETVTFIAPDGQSGTDASLLQDLKPLYRAVRGIGYAAQVLPGSEALAVRPGEGETVCMLGMRRLSSPALGAVSGFVLSGGTLIADAEFARCDQCDRERHGVEAGGRADLLGLRDAEVDGSETKVMMAPPSGSPEDGQTVRGGGRRELTDAIRARGRQEMQLRPGTRALARFADGSPAIVEHAYGKGRVVYMATRAGQLEDCAALRDLAKAILSGSPVKPATEVRLDEGRGRPARGSICADALIDEQHGRAIGIVMDEGDDDAPAPACTVSLPLGHVGRISQVCVMDCTRGGATVGSTPALPRDRWSVEHGRLSVRLPQVARVAIILATARPEPTVALDVTRTGREVELRASSSGTDDLPPGASMRVLAPAGWEYEGTDSKGLRLPLGGGVIQLRPNAGAEPSTYAVVASIEGKSGLALSPPCAAMVMVGVK